MDVAIPWIIEYKFEDQWYPVNGSSYAEDHMVKYSTDYPEHPYFKGNNIIISKFTYKSYSLFSNLKPLFESKIPEDISEYTKIIFSKEKAVITYKGYITGYDFLRIKYHLPEDSEYWADIMLDIFLKRTHHIIPPLIFHEEELYHYFHPKENNIEFISPHQKIDIEIKRKKLKEIEKKIFPLNKNPENWRIFIYYTG